MWWSKAELLRLQRATLASCSNCRKTISRAQLHAIRWQMGPNGSKHAVEIARLPCSKGQHYQFFQMLGVQEVYSKPQCNNGSYLLIAAVNCIGVCQHTYCTPSMWDLSDLMLFCLHVVDNPKTERPCCLLPCSMYHTQLNVNGASVHVYPSVATASYESALFMHKEEQCSNNDNASRLM